MPLGAWRINNFSGMAAPGPATDPFWNNVALLIRSNPDNALAHNYDAKFRNSTNTLTSFTRLNDEMAYTVDAPFSGAKSLYTFGTVGFYNGGIVLPSTSDLLITGDFTIECWVRVPNNISQQPWAVVFMGANSGFHINSAFSPAHNNKFVLAGDWGMANSNIASNDNAWHHLAVSRSGSTVRAYVDGVAFHTGTYNGALDFRGVGLGNALQADNWAVAKISNYRISDVARYTANFAVPTANFAWDSNTKALFLGNEGVFMDFSPNKLPIIQKGTNITRETAFKKFADVDTLEGTEQLIDGGLRIPRYDAGIVRLPTDALTMDGDFTFECWFNIPTNAVVTDTDFFWYTGGDAGEFELQAIQSGPNINLRAVYTFLIDHTIPNVNDGQWHHFAFVRAGTGANNVKIFYDGVEVSAVTFSTSSWPGFAGSNNMPFSGGRFGGSQENARFFGHPYTEGVPTAFTDGVRITKGVARYTANFTPPTESYPLA